MTGRMGIIPSGTLLNTFDIRLVTCVGYRWRTQKAVRVVDVLPDQPILAASGVGEW